MKVTVTEQSASERKLKVIVDAKQVETAFQKAFKKNLNQFALPGFRKGKVPKPMAERYITDGALVSDVVNDLVPQAFRQAIEEQRLEPITQPDWNLIQNERGKDLVFEASFVISPILEISGYDGMEVQQEREEITEEHIDETLERMRGHHAEFVTLTEDRELQEGDHVVVDYSSFQNGEEIENGSVTNYLMEMKPENYIDGFVSNLVGAKAGEEREFDITFPEDYNNEELAGETISFKFKLHDIKVKQLPPLDDEFAKSHSEHESLETLRAAIRERLEAGIKSNIDGQIVMSVVQKLLDQVPEDVVPSQLRQHHAQKVIRSRMYEMSQRGLALEDLLAARGITQDEWIQEMMSAGVFESRLEVLYKSVARQEKITVDSKELDRVIKEEAKKHKMSPKQLRKQMEKNGAMEMLEYNLLMERIHKLFLEKAEVTYVAPGTAAQEESKKAKSSKEEKSTGESEKAESKAKKTKAAKEEPEEKEGDTEPKKPSKAKASGKTKKAVKKKSK